MSAIKTFTWQMADLEVSELEFSAPLDHRRGGVNISLFARIYTKAGAKNLPYLLYLQGGPGFEAPRATSASTPSWLASALKDFQVVMLDQRGTGRSSPIGADTKLPEGAISGANTLKEADAAAQAKYLEFFRADSIVADAEILRALLGIEKWSLLGQSFGGFTTLCYLSKAPESIDLALFTGGLPALNTELTEVYKSTWENLAARSEKFFRRFPHDHTRYLRLAELADAGKLILGSNQKVGVESLRRIGMKLGAKQGEEKLHYLLNLDFDSPVFKANLQASMPFNATNPIYALLHESCWADGISTNWAAVRAMPKFVKDDPSFLAGEHIHPEIFTEDPGLAVFKEAAEILASQQWPKLYDLNTLAQLELPLAAAIYYEDAYVPFAHSLATAKAVNGIKTFITNEYEHGGLASGTKVFEHILALAKNLS